MQALILFAKLRVADIAPNVISHNAAISACEKGGQWQHAMSLFEAIIEADRDVISYSATMNACQRGGQWQQALLLMEEMTRATIDAGVICYCAAMSACGRASQLQLVLTLMEEISKQALVQILFGGSSHRRSGKI